ncbi:MAG: sigma-70 family polymerase sigma factor [Clostridia bacterium]|jgi:RNA polymerase sigma-70 factor (ECF subfamily)|nr:sigma-70 family polymerase sigma factor [Clostridia bacterium]
MKFEDLVKKYTKLVYKICLDMLLVPQDAEDITQEVYLSLYKSIGRYKDLNENELKNIICKIALNKCKDTLKAKINKYNEFNIFEDISNYEDYASNNNIDEEIFKQEKSMYIIKTINELKQPYKDILYDYYINEYSLDEIEEKLNIPKATLKVNIYRGKKILEKVIREDGGEILSG